MNLLSIVTVSLDREREQVRGAVGAGGVGWRRESQGTGAGVVERRQWEGRGESVEVRRGRDVRGRGGDVR